MTTNAQQNESQNSAGCCAPSCCSPEDKRTSASVRTGVKAAYAKAAESESFCGTANNASALALGYSESELAGKEDANLGLGCGNPHAIASIQQGETVLDLGSGAGFDALIAAPRLGENGRFIGVDMTPEMLAKARKNIVDAGHERNIEFREGLIEALPVASSSVDVAISNCVINLSPDKGAVFKELFRVLKPGGRIAISDIVLDEPLPRELQESGQAWNACLGGALHEEEYLGHIKAAGFTGIAFERKPASMLLQTCGNDPLTQELINNTEPATLQRVLKTVYSYSIRAQKSADADDKVGVY